MLDTNNPSIGRFDKSFLVHMIKDFFLVLLAVSILEFALKAAAIYYNYTVNEASEAQVVADDLAKNVRSIMRNEGWPVSARPDGTAFAPAGGRQRPFQGLWRTGSTGGNSDR